MTDKYWDRLVTAHNKRLAAGADDPNATWPDPELGAWLFGVRDGEASYKAPDVGTREVMLSHQGGSFRVRIYVPHTPAAARPLLVWNHGGAWAAGDLDMPEADATSREVASAADAVVVSVDYRRAVEGLHYPAPLDDVVHAFRWAYQHADELGADRGRVTLGGASAGANLAAGAALRLRDEAAPMPRSLILAYPTLHPELPQASSELQGKLDRMSGNEAFMPEAFNVMVENYLGGPASDAPMYGMPGVAPDLTRMPVTYIVNDEFDALRSSAELFADQLRRAGTDVVLETVPGVPHGHLNRPGIIETQRSYADLAAWVREQTVPQAAVVLDGVAS